VRDLVRALRDELPYVQKLYDKVRGSADLPVIALNMDDNTGLIEPFMKENGYTFPALPALDYERARSVSASARSVLGSSARRARRCNGGREPVERYLAGRYGGAYGESAPAAVRNLAGGMQGGLLFVVLHFDRFQVFGFKYLTAIQTFEIIDAIPAGDNLGTGVIASSRHMQRLDEVYFKRAGALVKPFYTPLHPGIQSRVPKAGSGVYPERIEQKRDSDGKRANKALQGRKYRARQSRPIAGRLPHPVAARPGLPFVAAAVIKRPR
jgi:hypothetical protein